MGTGQSLTFGTLLRRYRRAAGLTQEELAGRAELSVEAISALERGVSRAPHKDTVELLAEALRLAAQDRAMFEAAARRRDEGAGQGALEAVEPYLDAAPAPLVGRVRELDLLDRYLTGKGPPILLFVGEPGIGKSRLLREAMHRGRAGGWSVLQGVCYRRAGQGPYAPILEALQGRIRGQSPAQLRMDLQQCGWLVRLLPELAETSALPPSPAPLPPEQERRLMFNAVGRFLANVGGPAGTLLVLDDLQWAPSDALDLLSALVHSTIAVPLRVVGAYRDTEVTPQIPLAAALADLARTGLAARCTLDPLSDEEAGHLLGRLLDGAGPAEQEVRERVLRRAGGVPFYLVSCVQGLHAGALLTEGPDAVPWDVAETIRQRVAMLPEAAQELLGAVAVAGHRVSRTMLIYISGRDGWNEQEVVLALDAAVRARLLAEVGEDAYQFAHNLIGEVVWSMLSTAHRAVLHRRVAEALEREPGTAPADELAYHFGRCGDREQSVIYLERAGDRAQAMHATVAAEGYYRQLVARLDELGRADERARARVKLGAVLRLLARYDEALEVLEQATQDYRTIGNHEGQRLAIALIGRIHARRGTTQEGLARIQTLLKAGGGSEPSAGGAALQAALAELYFGSGQYREQLAAAERAATLARAVHDDALIAQAEQWRSTALLTLGRPDEALPLLEEVIPLAEAVGDLSSHLHALNHTALAYTQRGEFETSRQYIERALSIAQLRGDTVQIAFMTCNRGMLVMLTGEWAQARRDFEQAATLMRQIPVAWTSPYPLLGLGHLCLVEGQWETAARYLQEAIALAERSGDLQALRYALVPLVERDVLEGRLEVARARLERLLDRRKMGWDEGAAHILTLLGWTLLELGDETEAQQVVTQGTTRAIQEHNRLALVEARRVQAMLAMRRRRWQEATDSLDEALAVSRDMPCPYNEARVLYLYGLLHTQKGEPVPARERLVAARGILRGLGEHLYARFVDQALAALSST